MQRFVPYRQFLVLRFVPGIQFKVQSFVPGRWFLVQRALLGTHILVLKFVWIDGFWCRRLTEIVKIRVNLDFSEGFKDFLAIGVLIFGKKSFYFL